MDLRAPRIHWQPNNKMAKEDEDPSVYLENVVFPILLPGIEETLRVAKKTEVRLGRCLQILKLHSLNREENGLTLWITFHPICTGRVMYGSSEHWYE